MTNIPTRTHTKRPLLTNKKKKNLRHWIDDGKNKHQKFYSGNKAFDRKETRRSNRLPCVRTGAGGAEQELLITPQHRLLHVKILILIEGNGLVVFRVHEEKQLKTVRKCVTLNPKCLWRCSPTQLGQTVGLNLHVLETHKFKMTSDGNLLH